LTELEDRVRGEVGKVLDPETGQSFAEMQMIINVREESQVSLDSSLFQQVHFVH
jgi:hypothetical protein